MTQGDVIPIRQTNPLFGKELRQQLVEVSTPYTDKPTKLVQDIEGAVAALIVRKAIDAGEALGRYLGKLVSNV